MSTTFRALAVSLALATPTFADDAQQSGIDYMGWHLGWDIETAKQCGYNTTKVEAAIQSYPRIIRGGPMKGQLMRDVITPTMEQARAARRAQPVPPGTNPRLGTECFAAWNGILASETVFGGHFMPSPAPQTVCTTQYFSGIHLTQTVCE